jgi:excisionase family DNA binding protein
MADNTGGWDFMFHGKDEQELLLTTQQVSELVGLSKDTLNRLRLKGGGPPFVHMGRAVRYKLSEVYAWMENQKSYTSTSDVSVNKAK